MVPPARRATTLRLRARAARRKICLQIDIAPLQMYRYYGGVILHTGITTYCYQKPRDIPADPPRVHKASQATSWSPRPRIFRMPYIYTGT